MWTRALRIIQLRRILLVEGLIAFAAACARFTELIITKIIKNKEEKTYWEELKRANKIPDIYDKITKLVDSHDAEKYGIYIYRIDLNKSKKGTYINFYADDMMDCEDAVYTYNNIPPECLRLIDIIK